MTLLPREQAALNEIARSFRDEDLTFAHWLSGRTRLRHPKMAIALVYLLAPALIVAGVAVGAVALTVAGIVLAVPTPVAGWWLIRPRRQVSHDGRVVDDL
jgi:hypothetical protein